MTKRKKPAGEGGQSVYRTITIYSHGVVEVKKTKSKRGKAVLERRLNTNFTDIGKRKIMLGLTQAERK